MSVAVFPADVPQGRIVGRYKEDLLCDPCAYCGGPADVLDHIVPRVRGGGSTADNLTAACTRCNNGKSRKSLLAFLGFKATRLRERFEAICHERTLWAEVGR